jgi:hypothetical protein
MAEAVERAVAVQCRGLRCPACGSSKHLVCEFRGDSLKGTHFEFQALLKCTATLCRFSSAARRILRSLSKVTDIEVSVLGIKIKKVRAKGE